MHDSTRDKKKIKIQYPVKSDLPQEVKLFSLDFCQDLGSLRSVKKSKSTGREKSSGNCKNPLDFGELNGP
jgi:hypothetical protein